MGIARKVLLTTCLLAVVHANHQTYPGTTTRPILSDAEAAVLSEANYLQGWSPEEIVLPHTPDYIVGPEQNYTDIQAAVNAAIRAGGSTRKYIQIEPGTYSQTVFVTGDAALTIYGAGSKPSDIEIVLGLGAGTNVNDWINIVNPQGQRYKEGDPAYSLYQQCAEGNETVGTFCTSVFWIASENTQIYNLKVVNTFNGSNGTQAVALRTDADKIQLSKLYLISGQDTFYLGSGDKGVLQRVYVDHSHIEGDIDFVFGGASVVFNRTTFKAVSSRHPQGAIIFAPNTHPNNPFGFLLVNSVITADDNFKKSKKVKLGRAWDHFTPAGQYKPGITANGQVLIRQTKIDLIMDTDEPWTTSTSTRPFSGNVDINRDLNNNNFNRFWEYRNTGDGA